MRKIFTAILCLLFLAAGFAAGRLSLSAPYFQVGELAGEDPLEAAFEDFIGAQRDTIELFRNSDFFEDDQERAEAYRGVLYALIGSIRAGALKSHDHPRFMRAVDWTSKSGLDNPDNNYYFALISDSANYRITGNRGSTAQLIFQLVVGQPGVRGAGSSTNVSLVYGRDLILDDEGNFEIIVSRDDPGPGVNWLRNGDGAESILVRHTHNDWTTERDAPLLIEKIGAEGEHAMPLTPGRMARGLRDAAVHLFDRNVTWLGFAERSWNLRPRNGIAQPAPTRGGLIGQYSAFGSWDLNNNQALVLSTAPSSAVYQGIELGNLWFISLDYETRTSSLNLSQMDCSSDGRCYAVISHRDPGIRNWLDTEGHRRGLIMMRWQGLDGPLPESQYPRVELVDFDSIRAHLPEDTPEFSAEQRREQIRTRRASVLMRFRG